MACCLRTSRYHSIYLIAILAVVLIGVEEGEGKSPPTAHPHPNIILENDGGQENSQPAELHRDPFKRRILSNPIPKPSTPSKIGPETENFGWQLLGIIHGPAGHQAIIQKSPNERTILYPESELAQSGWTVKTINPNEVVMERASTSSSMKNPSPPQNFILSFPSSQKRKK